MSRGWYISMSRRWHVSTSRVPSPGLYPGLASIHVPGLAYIHVPGLVYIHVPGMACPMFKPGVGIYPCPGVGISTSRRLHASMPQVPALGLNPGLAYPCPGVRIYPYPRVGMHPCPVFKPAVGMEIHRYI